MSYITEELLTAELQRLYAEAHPGEEPPVIKVVEKIPPYTEYYVHVGGAVLPFSVETLDLIDMPIGYVSEAYLEPLLETIEDIDPSDRLPTEPAPA